MSKWSKKRQRKGKERSLAQRNLKKEISNKKRLIENRNQHSAKPKDDKFEPRLSDHAIVRFMERFMEVDIAKIRKKILTPPVVEAIRAGARTFSMNGVTYCIKNNTITTVHHNRSSVRKKHI